MTDRLGLHSVTVKLTINYIVAAVIRVHTSALVNFA